MARSAIALGVIAAALGMLTATPAALGQDARAPLSSAGKAVMTGFSGTAGASRGILSRGEPGLDQTFIDLDGASLKVFDISSGGAAPGGQVLEAAPLLAVPAREIGQVFGLALDDAEAPNVYAAASSAFGLQIVAGGDSPRRIKVGQEGARFMDGQFGAGGGPGSIWRIDGVSGAVSLFADIRSRGAPNSGPGLGDIAFDPDHQQFYVSDFDTGLIHRLDISGKDLGVFDHGVDGRPEEGLDPLPDDPAARADVERPDFDAEDPDSWGFTAPERRIWGLAYHGGRLHYAVWDGPEIWSVGIAEDGTFAGDARREIILPADARAYPVASIAFDGEGRIYLAQRGEIRSRFDYGVFALPRRSRVLRYGVTAAGLWTAEPEDYAVGFPATHQNAAGGVSLGYGYDEDGRLDTESCYGTLWATGDSLRESASERDRLAQGGPAIVHGAQGMPAVSVLPENSPPWTSYFLDYDERLRDPNAAGLVGDIVAIQSCPPAPSPEIAEAAPEDEPPAPQEQATAPEEPASAPPPPPPATQEEAGPPTGPFDLAVNVRRGLRDCAADQDCPFVVTIANEGDSPWNGPLALSLELDIALARLVDWGPDPWSCEPDGTTFACRHPSLTLAPGAMKVLELSFVPRRVPVRLILSCASIPWSSAMLRPRNALVQESLAALGFDPGPVDGIVGTGTRAAIAAFRRAEGMRPGDAVDADLMTALVGRWGTGDGASANDRACAESTLVPPGAFAPAGSACSPGAARVDGRCTSLSSLCTGGRVWQPSADACACPAERPAWASGERRCIAQAATVTDAPAVDAEPAPSPSPASPEEDAPATGAGPAEPAVPIACPGNQAWNAAEKRCACPSDRPVWDRNLSTCVSATIEPEKPKIAICTGGRQWSADKAMCVCPPETPEWDAAANRCSN